MLAITVSPIWSIASISPPPPAPPAPPGGRAAGRARRGAVTARQRQRRGLADLANSKRIDKTFERNLAPPPDRLEQVAHRGLAVPFDLFQAELDVARFQREDVGRL